MDYCNDCVLSNCVDCPKVTLQSLYYHGSTLTVTPSNLPSSDK